MAKMLNIYKKIYMHLHTSNEIEHTDRDTILAFGKTQNHLQWRSFSFSEWASGKIENFWENMIPRILEWWINGIEAELYKDDSFLYVLVSYNF